MSMNTSAPQQKQVAVAAFSQEQEQLSTHPQRLGQDVQAALSQPGNRTPREAELESLLRQTFRCFLTVHAQLQEALQENRWTAKLLAVPASILSPSHKATLYAAAKAIQRAAPDGQKLVPIESWNLCKTVGQSKDTFLDNLTYLSEKVGVLRKETQRVVTEDGAYTTNLYIGTTDLTAHPERYHVEKPRNHGGARLLCPHCHSDRLQKKVTITCMGCGAVLNEHTSQVNKEETAQPGIPGTLLLQKRQVADPDQEALFPPAQDNLTTDITNNQERHVADPDENGMPDGELLEQEPGSPPATRPGAISNDLGELMQNAATLLVEIAGTEPAHIEMSSRGPMKYYEVKRPFGLDDARDHLAGKKTKGAMVRRSDGMTRALCYDADTDDDWLALREAAHLLASAGYTPLVEDSPVGRGGHLWIIYTDLVDARCAHRHVRELAPMLQAIKECWPGSGNHKVRLPGGRYVKPGFSQQCKLYDFIGGQVAANRREAAHALLTMQTPASIVPAYPPDAGPGSSSQTIAPSLTGETSRSQQLPPARARAHGQAAQRAQQTNPYHWFHFTPAQLAAWYNERHTLEELRPLQQNGMAYSPTVSERTPSTDFFLTQHGEERWADHSARARRANGRPDGGDALELRIRLSGQSKPEVLRQVGRELVKEARAALETAASAGHQPPLWVQELLTPAGKAHFQELLLQSTALPTEGALTLAGDLYQKTPLPGDALPAARRGGLPGSCPSHSPAGVSSLPPAFQPGQQVSAPYPPPARASYCCRSTAWLWSEAKQRYVCGNCQI